MTCLVKITRMNLKVESPSCQAFKENQIKNFIEIREGLLEKGKNSRKRINKL